MTYALLNTRMQLVYLGGGCEQKMAGAVVALQIHSFEPRKEKRERGSIYEESYAEERSADLDKC